MVVKEQLVELLLFFFSAFFEYRGIILLFLIYEHLNCEIIVTTDSSPDQGKKDYVMNMSAGSPDFHGARILSLFFLSLQIEITYIGMKTIILLIFTLLLSAATGCKKKSDDRSNPSVNLGAVGNSWTVKVQGTTDISAELTASEGSMRTVQVSWAKVFSKTVKFGLTTNEVIDYVYSDGDVEQPFTMVKFDAKVGDIYSTTIDGIIHTREVIEKKTYNIPALGKDLETIGVNEIIPVEIPSTFFGYTIRQIIWYWNPVYGLVCVDVYTDQGEYFTVDFITINV